MINKNKKREIDILIAKAFTILLPLLLSTNKKYKPEARLNSMHKIKSTKKIFNIFKTYI